MIEWNQLLFYFHSLGKDIELLNRLKTKNKEIITPQTFVFLLNDYMLRVQCYHQSLKTDN